MLDWLLLAGWIGCQSLDIETTRRALARPGFYEANPVMRGPHLYYAKVSVNVAGLILWKKIRPHKGPSRVLAGVYTGVGCTGGVLNLRTLRR